jgi:hypothetical protein
MIYVKRDFTKVDANVLAAAAAATAVLDAITDEAERKAFIKANSGVWTAFRPALREMSHGKCWYSEAFEAVSRYDVDHFRPKGKAKISQTETSDGYSWLAFDPNNYVLAGALCNQANREYAEATVGKANWFPLYDTTKAATLAARDISSEQPILLDPTVKESADLLEFNEAGEVHPNSSLEADYQKQVDWAINLLGIRQSQLNDARRLHVLPYRRLIETYKDIARKAPSARTVGEQKSLKGIAEDLIEASRSKSPFSATIRALLQAEGLPQFIVRDELS